MEKNLVFKNKSVRSNKHLNNQLKEVFKGIFLILMLIYLPSCSSLPISEVAQESILRKAKDKIFQNKERDAVDQWKILQDAALILYVSQIGEKIRHETKLTAINYLVINTPVVQAVSEYNSSTVYVTLGMLNSIENEAELGCLLGHELHHQEQFLKNIKPGQSSSTTSTIIDVITPGSLRRLGIKQDLEDFSFSNQSKASEKEADEQGSVLCARAGYDAFALARLQKRLATKIQNSPFEKIRNMKGTHDQLQDRAHDLSEWLKNNNYKAGTGKTGTTEYLNAFRIPKKNLTLVQQNSLASLANYEKELAFFKTGKKSISLNRIIQIGSAVSKIVKQENITPEELYQIASSHVMGDRFMQERVLNAFNRFGNAHDAILSKVFSVLDALGRITIGFTPLGAVIDFHDVLTGKDFFTGETLSKTQRIISTIGLVIGQGQNFRRLEALGSGVSAEVKVLIKTSEKIVETEVKPILGNRYVKDLPELSGSEKTAFEGHIFSGSMQPGDIVYQVQRTGQVAPGRWATSIKPINAEHAEEMLNINKWGNDAGQIKAYRFKESVSGYAGKITGGSGHQFKIPNDVPLNEVLEEVQF